MPQGCPKEAQRSFAGASPDLLQGITRAAGWLGAHFRRAVKEPRSPPNTGARTLNPWTKGGKHPTTNIQPRTSNDCHSRKHWMLSVGCWLLDVPDKPSETHRQSDDNDPQRILGQIDIFAFIGTRCVRSGSSPTGVARGRGRWNAPARRNPASPARSYWTTS
jgi:hypothetical protein